jgi:hypothetical protein
MKGLPFNILASRLLAMWIVTKGIKGFAHFSLIGGHGTCHDQEQAGDGIPKSRPYTNS